MHLNANKGIFSGGGGGGVDGRRIDSLSVHVHFPRGALARYSSALTHAVANTHGSYWAGPTAT